MNFTFVLKEARNGEYGVLQEDGTWSGMIGAVNERECDMGKKLNVDFYSANLQTKLFKS